MLRLNKTLTGLATSAVILLSGGLAVALDSDVDPTVEQRLMRACERGVEVGSPQGHRDMAIAGYQRETPLIGIVKGSLKTQIPSKRWAKVNWTCRVHPKSGRVLRVEFAWPSGGTRLMAAASYLR